MREQMELIKSKALDAIEVAETSAELNDVRVRFLGKSGEMTNVMKGLATVPKEEKPAMGKLLNEVRFAIENALETKTKLVVEREKQARLKAETVDITFPATFKKVGTLHPITKIKNEIEDIFLQMGFSVEEGRFNFQLLNVPKDHPAREMQDTFYCADDIVLRTQTSSIQARIMLEKQPPIRVISPGMVFRSDDDASHSPVFHQMEGLAIDEHITIGDLTGCLLTFAQKMFSEDTKVRLRPSYFPFTEPSVEVDVTCSMCHGKGCKLCKGTGWMEILGAGIVNPAVLDMCGIDSKKYGGFAFGFGIERIAMIKYGIPNIKYFYENDVRFLNQFND